MERALGRPQDMEWAIGPGQSGAREVFSSRPDRKRSEPAHFGAAERRRDHGDGPHPPDDGRFTHDDERGLRTP